MTQLLLDGLGGDNNSLLLAGLGAEGEEQIQITPTIQEVGGGLSYFAHKFERRLRTRTVLWRRIIIRTKCKTKILHRSTTITRTQTKLLLPLKLTRISKSLLIRQIKLEIKGLTVVNRKILVEFIVKSSIDKSYTIAQELDRMLDSL